MKTEPAAIEMDWPSWLKIYAVAIALFHLWANTWGTLPALWLNSLHFGLLGSLVCWVAATDVQWRKILFGTCGVLTLVGGCYLPLAEEALRARGEYMTILDMLVAGGSVLLALFLCRRTSGWTIPIIVAVAIAYITVLGRYLDGVLHFRGLGLERVLYRYYFTGEGLFGLTATISATFVFMFILFSAFLLKSGGADFIIRLARVATCRLPGGAGYVAIVSSGLTGMITGSAVANTVSTGAITIPMMKRAGFKGSFAGGLEAAASTGGQFMPPVMGAGAFLMAQFTGLPYATIVAASLLPAILYFLSLGFFVFIETRKMELRATEAEVKESLVSVLSGGLHFIIPVVVLVWLLVAGFSPTYAAGVGIVAVVLSSWLTRQYRMGWGSVMEALALGTRNAAPTALLLLCAGLVIGSLNMTGTGVALSQLVVGWSGGYLLAALVLIALASLVLGMGLPVTAAYVMMAVVAVPALQELGVALLAAHLIVFWFSQDSNVTPPVALAAFAASGISGASALGTSLQSWKMAKALYVIPLLFAYTPFIEGDWGERIGIAVFAAGGLFFLTMGISRYLLRPLRAWEIALAFVCAILLFYPTFAINLAGVVLGAVLVRKQCVYSGENH